MIIAIGAAPLHAQTLEPAPPTRDITAPVATVGQSRGGDRAWLDQAIRTAARVHAGGLTQSPSAASSSGGGSCAKRIVLFTLLGTGVSVGAAGILLASTGGSDDTKGILTRWALLGVGVGSLVGAVTCLAPEPAIDRDAPRAGRGSLTAIRLRRSI